MARRNHYPVEPLRWIHKRQGVARTTQHVVARPGPGVFVTSWSTPCLCAASVSTGRYNWRKADRGERLSLGPKTQRPLVTTAPDPSLPFCANCLRALRSLGYDTSGWGTDQTLWPRVERQRSA